MAQDDEAAIAIDVDFKTASSLTDLEGDGWSFNEATLSTKGLTVSRLSKKGSVTTPEVTNPSKVEFSMENSGTSNREVIVSYLDQASSSWIPLEAHTVTVAKETVSVEILESLGTTQIKFETNKSNDVIITQITIYGQRPISTQAEVLGFRLPDQIGEEVIDAEARTIAVNMAEGSDLNLVPEFFMLSPMATVSPDISVACDFSVPVVYTVTAEDGTTKKDWTVTVILVKSTEKDITAFKLSDEQIGSASINSTNGTIKLKMPDTSDISNVVPSILKISSKADISPKADAAQNFDNSVVYTVTAQDESVKTWTVEVEKIDPNAYIDIDFNKVVGWAAATGGPAAATSKPATNVEINTTTGGKGGDIVYITPDKFNDMCLSLYQRINYKYTDNKPIIYVLEPGVYDGSGVTGDAAKVFSNNMLTIQEQGDISIIGKDNVQCKFGINIKRSYNIIIRNIYFWGYSDDAVNVGEKETHHVWIDHCTAGAGSISQTPTNKDAVDGTFEVKNGASYVTVSWSVTQNHWKSCLIGHSDSNGSTDTGRLKVTHYANYYHNTYSRHPRVRFGEVHVLNCMYENAGWGRDNSYKTAASIGLGYGSAASNSSQVFIEGCFFQDVQFPFYADRSVSDYKSIFGLDKSSTGNKPCAGLRQTGNEYDDSGLTLQLSTKGVPANMLNEGGKSIKFDELNPDGVFNPSDYYSYSTMTAAQVKDMVTAYAGAGVLEWAVFDPEGGGTSICPETNEMDLVKVFASGTSIIVSGIEENADVKVYTLSGVQVYKGVTTSYTTSLPVTFNNGIHIVTVNGKGYKVLVK